MKKEIINIIYIIFCISFVWLSLTSMVQSFKNPKLTQTEVFLLIPHTFVLDFKEK